MRVLMESDDVGWRLLRAVPTAVVAIDADGEIVFANEQVERLFGWSRDELVDQRIEELFRDDETDVGQLLRPNSRSEPDEGPISADLKLRARRRDGSEFPAEISVSSFETADGVLMAAAITDVTDTRRSEAHFRGLLTAAPDAMVAVDSTGRIELVNEQAELLFGWSASDLLGEMVEVLVPESAGPIHPAHRTHFLTDPRTRPMGAGIELSARRKDGSTFPAEISLSAVTDDADEVVVLAAVRDISDRVELENQRRRDALESQRERAHRLVSLGQLAGGIAHDFNNLLGIILNYATLVAREVTEPQVAADIDEIRAAAERAAGLTRQLLAFARQDRANPEPLEVNEVVTGVASMLGRTLGAHVDLRLELDHRPLVAVADRHHVEQIIMNLALNARDAMSTGGTLTIRTGRSEGNGDHVVLDIIDSGSGMSPEVVARVFEPFFTTKPTGEGTGLGLATVHGIVGQNGGDIAIDSVVGKGTTVSVRLPRVGDLVPTSRAIEHAADGGRERVLVVEDELALRVATARILSDHGYDVVTAADGVEALVMFEADPSSIDVVLSDVLMPKMRGDDMAQRMIEIDPTVRVLLVSGYDSGSVLPPGGVLPKPVAEDDLLRALREVLGD